MKKRFYNKQAQATLEYIVFIVFIFGALIVFQKYLTRSFVGRWKTAGDGMGSERIYDLNSTECAFDFVQNPPGVWYDTACFKANCKNSCLINIPNPQEIFPACRSCINNCRSSVCEGSERGN